MKTSGTFNGTGAVLYVCCGFKPDWVRIQNIESTSLEAIEWSTSMRSAEIIAGIKDTGSATTELTLGNGIAHYSGGDLITAASTSYIVKDPSPDKRDAGTAGTINQWTLGNYTNKTGNWNAECSTTYVGEGSRICIRNLQGYPVMYLVTAVSSNGEAANEVTLNAAAPSGEILFLSGMYDYIGASAGIVTPAGFILAADSDVNASGEMCMFEAGTYNA
jgi:hypothetical protein